MAFWWTNVLSALKKRYERETAVLTKFEKPLQTDIQYDFRVCRFGEEEIVDSDLGTHIIYGHFKKKEKGFWKGTPSSYLTLRAINSRGLSLCGDFFLFLLFPGGGGSLDQ